MARDRESRSAANVADDAILPVTERLSCLDCIAAREVPDLIVIATAAWEADSLSLQPLRIRLIGTRLRAETMRPARVSLFQGSPSLEMAILPRACALGYFIAALWALVHRENQPHGTLSGATDTVQLIRRDATYAAQLIRRKDADQ